MKTRAVPESVYRDIEDSSKQRLSNMIRNSHLKVNAIVEQTGIGRAAIRRAIDCKGIRFDTAIRLQYFLEWYDRNNRKNN